MRELKFRAWSIKKRKYLDIDTLYCANGKVCGVVCDSVVYDTDNIILEQDTGLKDKNGKKICDGDIVKYISFNNKEYIGQVVFGFVADSEGYYVAKHYGWGIRREDFNNSLGDYADDDMECEYVEVIGNIHENKELLK